MSKLCEFMADHCRNLSPERAAAYVIQSALDAQILKGLPVAIFRLSGWLELLKADTDTNSMGRFKEACRVSRLILPKRNSEEIVYAAGALLMPGTWFRADVTSQQYSSYELAERYAVPYILYGLRLRQLGLGY